MPPTKWTNVIPSPTSNTHPSGTKEDDQSFLDREGTKGRDEVRSTPQEPTSHIQVLTYAAAGHH